ncbi:hypothetical protein RvY_01036-2 [Ramazzottius varieornatus]|uniref:Chitin-binding type-2 domain-containing protein n=1 Tax=Ramazzottius varieornatus TaxID=947166 RepID=A0A1D1UIV8_RAMVA|nr:hypothetical protein RvY_01036-2 [Ramazzottius varieornatus]
MLLTIRVRSDENGSQSIDGVADDQPGSFECAGKLGIFPDLRSGCRFFHRCAPNGQMETHQCAGITIFNPRAGICVDPNTFTCPTTNTTQPTSMTERMLRPKEFDCRKQNGFFADVSNGCRSYYFCAQDGKSYKFVCPLNYQYSEVKEACDAPDRTPCESHLSIAKNLVPTTGEMVAQASNNFVTRTRFQPPAKSPSPKTITNGWISAPETPSSRSATRQDSTWSSFPDDQHFVVSSHLESPTPPNKPNFPSSGPVIVQPVPQSPPSPPINNQQVVNGFIVGTSPNGHLHFDPSFSRQLQPRFFHPPLSPPLQGVAQTVIKNITPPNDMRALTHRTFPDGQFVGQLRQGENIKPSSNSLFSIIPANAPLSQLRENLRPDPSLVIQEQLLAFEMARQRNAQLVELQERKRLQDRLNQLKNTGPPFSGQFVHLTTDTQPVHKVSSSQKELLTRHPFDLQQDIPQRILSPATFPSVDTLTNQPGTECTLGVRGYFPDVSSDCRNYFFCDGRGHRIEHTCPPGMAFNTTLIACDLDMFPTCRKTHFLMSKSMATGLPVADRGNTCSGRKTGYYANFAHRCAKYFYCSMRGDQIEYSCPMDFFFDEFRGVCVEFGDCVPSFAHIEGAATTTQQLKEMGFALAGRFPRQFDQIGHQVTDIFGPALSLLGRRTEEFSFPCREIGHFADFDSGCNGFWACTDTVSMAKLVKCPMGQQFDPVKKHCAPAFMVQCLPPTEQKRSLGTAGFSCLGRTPTFHADIAEQCRKFHHCTIEGEMLSYTCPFDWLYNEQAGECVAPDNFTCPSQKKSQHYTFDCVGKSGYYADFEHQCQFFHLCLLNGTRTTMACPTAMVFDENESKCVYGTLCAPTPASADHLDISFGNNGNTESSFQCPIGVTGFFGDPLFSCRTYWQCTAGARLNNRSCPGLLRFNATTQTCEQARHVICADPLVLESLFPGLLHGPGSIAPRMQPFNQFSPFRLPLDSFNKFFDPSVQPVAPPPDFTFSPNRLVCEPGQIGFFAEPKSNCRTFFYCEADGVKKHFACPSNMLFDETVGRCQDETASVCGPRVFFQQRALNPANFGFGQEGASEGVPVGICGGRVGLFADISSGCHNFFMCHANGSLVNQSCPGSLLFNERSFMCDWPTNVRCGETAVQSQNLLLGMPVGPRFNPIDPSGNVLFIPGSIPGSLFQVPSFGEQSPNDPFSRSMTPFQLSPSEQASIDFPKYSADGKHLELALGSSNPSRFSPVDAYGRPHPGVVDTNLRLHPQLPVSLQGSRMVGESYSPYGSRVKWLARRMTTTTTAAPTTTGLPTTTGRPGWEEGEYEPEEGVMPPAVTTTAIPLPAATTTPIAVVRSMPLMYDPLLGYSNLNHPLSDAIKPKSKIPTSTMDPVKSFGVDCYGKKGYFLSPGTSCKSYVFCKPHGAIYSFTCPGEYLYNAEKEICDWPDNVICASTSSRTAPKGSLRRWRRALASSNVAIDTLSTSAIGVVDSSFVCPNASGYFANQDDSCFSFFYCDENQTATRHECQDRNLRFDEARGVCEWSTRVRCGNGSLTADSTMSSTINVSQNFSVASSLPHDCPFTGFFADFSSGCRNFSFCPTTEGPRLIFRCPEGLLYDDSKGKCQNAAVVTCTRHKQSRSFGAKVKLVTRTRLVSSNADSPVDCRNQRGLFADPKSHCANFFYCSPQGLKFEYACPEGMAFNNAVKACDDLLNSSCSLIP